MELWLEAKDCIIQLSDVRTPESVDLSFRLLDALLLNACARWARGRPSFEGLIHSTKGASDAGEQTRARDSAW